MTAVLKTFQRKIVDGMAALIADAAERADAAPGHRRQVAADLGLILLAAPTGSGKTLMVGSVLDKVSAANRIVWFWFAPFAPLIDQSRLSILTHHSALKPRALATDRNLDSTRAGDVFLTTWAAVAVRARDARQARSRTETMPGADELIEALRQRGFKIGCVVDEAHHSFHLQAEAGRFFREVVRPDITILATATPDDTSIASLGAALGHRNPPRVFAASREEAVSARLNKGALRVVTFLVSRPEERFVDIREAALYAGWLEHQRVKEDLATVGAAVTPLLLVQVDGDDGVDIAREALRRFGLPSRAIAVHTAREPDPDVVAMAADTTKEALIFKVAVALGFDAPRAFTLVSLRSAQDPDFGTQIIGRLMRVARPLQAVPLDGEGALGDAARRLDEAHVFLANPEMQGGLLAAADRLKALRSEISPLAGRLRIVAVGEGGREMRTLAPDGQLSLLEPPPDDSPAGPEAPDGPRAEGQSPQPAYGLPLAGGSGARPLVVDRYVRTAIGARTVPAAFALHRYPLRGPEPFPRRFRREELPQDMDALVAGIAARVRFDGEALAVFQKRQVAVGMRSREVFGDEIMQQMLQVPITRRKVAAQAQQLLLFNRSIDPGELARALLGELERQLTARGIPVNGPEELEMGLNLILTRFPDALRTAQRQCLAEQAAVVQTAELPEEIISPTPLDPAMLNLYRVFPGSMNGWERRFAELIDNDVTDTVRWWHRNLPHRPESVSIVMESGECYFPDFIVGVNGRPTPDNIGLAETKRDFQSVNARMKNRSRHREYGQALMLFLDDGTGEFMVVEQVLRAINQPSRVFEMIDLVRA
ncbi:DEAD/DEAH box helicase family protein [Azospirillum sp. SYSU D00513]|uniref:DEAD/DEAH box helicase family protein n=2 Tax=Pseudomonadati TaxID=3379134 RepID=UPI001A970DCA|nr:DEAD/DEAH box helicase family protein [Azospirillum sp. SYSU D00513]